MSERGTQRGVDFCIFMADHPLGEEKTAIGPDYSTIKAIKSRKIYQSFKRGDQIIVVKPDPTAPCLVDEFVNNDLTGRRGICYRCIRLVKAEK
ncbi:MAG TPA: hypothetical protein VLE44_00050 [Candidatus Saccharimonadales bacterium]|nr:hypothetical protein [Candidatus Saccharimonadales bacterium]